MISIANKHATAAGEFMSEGSLHCTSYVCLGPDRSYEEVWFEQTMESHHTGSGRIFGRGYSFALAWQIFIPVAGIPRTESSASGNVFRTAVIFAALVHRTVHLRKKHEQHTDLFQLTTIEQIPKWSQGPPSLLATHKYDVGLVKGAAPLMGHPKSDYRLCLTQHPLKQKAIDGIRPVFGSLLKAYEIDTAALLKHLAEYGHKANLKKLQFVQTQVTYLGQQWSQQRANPSRPNELRQSNQYRSLPLENRCLDLAISTTASMEKKWLNNIKTCWRCVFVSHAWENLLCFCFLIMMCFLFRRRLKFRLLRL